MSFALETLEESLDVALRERGLSPTKRDVQQLAQAVGDWLDMVANEEEVGALAWRMRVEGTGAPLGHWWSRRTLQGLARMLRRGR